MFFSLDNSHFFCDNSNEKYMKKENYLKSIDDAVNRDGACGRHFFPFPSESISLQM